MSIENRNNQQVFVKSLTENICIYKQIDNPHKKNITYNFKEEINLVNCFDCIYQITYNFGTFIALALYGNKNLRYIEPYTMKPIKDYIYRI